MPLDTLSAQAFPSDPSAIAGARGIRRRRGSRAHLSGIAAEEAVEAAYAARGASVLGRRLRNAAGEIDLVVELAGTVVFVEVKHSRAHRDNPIGARNRQRVSAAAAAWLATVSGPPPQCRFDAALVDGEGRIRIVENAWTGEGDCATW